MKSKRKKTFRKKTLKKTYKKNIIKKKTFKKKIFRMRQKGGGGEWYWSDREQSWRFYDPDPSTRREGAFTNQELGSSQNFFIKKAEKKAKADAEHQKEIDKLIKKGRDVSSRPPNRQVVDDAFAKKNRLIWRK